MDRNGKIIAYVGTMGAGKTKKLVSIYKKLAEEGKDVFVFKHSNDVSRDGFADKIVSRNGDSAPAIAVRSLIDIVQHINQHKVDFILIDEIQFFDDELTVDTLEGIALAGIDVYVFGLDLTSDFKSFGKMGEILACADEVKKLKTKCRICGVATARVSMFVGKDKKGNVHVGDIGDYLPVCRQCFYEDESQVEESQLKSENTDKFYEFEINCDDFVLKLGVYESDLTEAGYTVDDVYDINSIVGVNNLLSDLGYI